MTLTTLKDESFFHLQLELSGWITSSFWRTAKEAKKNEGLDIGESISRKAGEIKNLYREKVSKVDASKHLRIQMNNKPEMLPCSYEPPQTNCVAICDYL